LYPKEYIQFLVHFHGDRDYFECHEILEEYWKQVDPKNKDSIWVSLILLAVSCYHHRRANFTGAKRTLTKSLMIMKAQPQALRKLGINPVVLLDKADEQLTAIEAEKVYESFNIPLEDSKLIEICKAACEESGFTWGAISDMTNRSLIHRHKLRDRTDVIEKRKISLSAKKGSE